MVQPIIKKKIKTINKKNVSKKIQRGGVVSGIRDLNIGGTLYYVKYKVLSESSRDFFVGTIANINDDNIEINYNGIKVINISDILNIQELKDRASYFVRYIDTEDDNAQKSKILTNKEIMKINNILNLEELIDKIFIYVFLMIMITI